MAKIIKQCKLFLLLTVLALSSVLLSGCRLGTDATTKLRDLDFTVVSDDRLSDELKTIIDERKAQPFKVTYNDESYLYICIGYGEQKTGGYSIAVNSLYLTENAVYVNTSLLGPGPEDKTSDASSYPYIVIKTEYLDKTVVFE